MLLEDLHSSEEFQGIKDTVMAQMFKFDLTDEQLDQIPARKFLKMIDVEREAMKMLAPSNTIGETPTMNVQSSPMFRSIEL